MGEYALTAGLFGASERIFRIFNSRSRTIPIGISMSVNFQDENEVKDYLNTIGTEYRFGCYSEKNPECEYTANARKIQIKLMDDAT